jgi:Na+/glutamate symporter
MTLMDQITIVLGMDKIITVLNTVTFSKAKVERQRKKHVVCVEVVINRMALTALTMTVAKMLTTSFRSTEEIGTVSGHL